MSVRRGFGVCLAITALGCTEACRGGSRPSDRAGVDDIGSLPLLAIRRDLRVGSAENPDSGFSRISSITVGPDSFVYVLDSEEKHILVYNSSGRLVGTIGRPGEGPGEFGFPTHMGYKGDTLWVADLQEQRVTLFSRKGEVLASVPTPPVIIREASGLLVRMQGSALRQDGRLESYPIVAFPPGAKRTDSLVVPNLVFNRHGRVVDTLGTKTLFLPPVGRTVKLAGKKVSVPTAPGSAPLLIQTAWAHFVVERPRATASGVGTFTVTCIGAMDDTIYQRSYWYRPQHFPLAFSEALVRRSVPLVVRLTELDTATVERALRNAMKLPPFQTPISLAIAGVDGSLWLRREDNGGPSLWWDVLDGQGEPLGRFQLPRNVTVLWARVGMFYGSEVDSLGIPRLVRYHVRRSSGQSRGG